MLFRRRYTGKTDDELMAMIAKADHGAFQELVSRHQQGVFNFAFRFLGNREEIKDIAQEAFLRVFQAAERYQPTGQFKSFLFRIVRNLCFDYLNKKKPVYMDDLPERPTASDPFSDVEKALAAERLQDALLALPDSQRMALLLHHFEGLKYADVASVMQTSVPAVESLLVRAKRTLVEKMKPPQ
jgi:RNA polymerase sigma-70 factor (ECF subfamily)